MVDVCYPEGTDWSCYGDQAAIDALDPDVKARSEALAWSTLAALTGYRLTLCPLVIRPCAARCSIPTWFVAPVWDGSFAGAPAGGAFQPFVSNGSWYNACGCSQPGDCSCTTLPEVVLPGGGTVVSVEIDGATLDPSAYRVDNGDRLVRIDGDVWPACNDGTFLVSYYARLGPNDLFRYAAGVLAAEFYKACSGGKCRLPQGVTSVARQGVTFEIASGLFTSGWTGIREVDAVIRIYNPNGLVQPSRVMSPDKRRGRITTWSA